MSFVYPNERIAKWIEFNGPSTGMPTVAQYENGIVIDSLVLSDGSGHKWLADFRIPTNVLVGNYYTSVATANIFGTLQHITVVEGSIVELSNLSHVGRDWTDEQRDRLIDLFGLDEEPFVPGPVVLPPLTDPLKSVGYLITYNSQGVRVPNSLVKFALVRAPGRPASSYTTKPFSIQSNHEALLTVELPRNAVYKAWVDNSGKGVIFTVPDSDSFAIPQIFDIV